MPYGSKYTSFTAEIASARRPDAHAHAHSYNLRRGEHLFRSRIGHTGKPHVAESDCRGVDLYTMRSHSALVPNVAQIYGRALRGRHGT